MEYRRVLHHSEQNVGGSSCKLGCGGAGAAQIGIQKADTEQWAGALSVSKQNAVNGNAPVNIAGGDITAGDSSATQDANSESEAKASNDADTTQKQDQEQNIGSDCGCGKDNHKDSKDGKDGRDGKGGHDCGW